MSIGGVSSGSNASLPLETVETKPSETPAASGADSASSETEPCDASGGADEADTRLDGDLDPQTSPLANRAAGRNLQAKLRPQAELSDAERTALARESVSWKPEREADEAASLQREQNVPEIKTVITNRMKGARRPSDVKASLTDAIAEAGERGLLDRDRQILDVPPGTLLPENPPYNTHSEYGDQINQAIEQYNQASLESYEKEYVSYMDSYTKGLDGIESLEDLAAHGPPPRPIDTAGYDMDTYAAHSYDQACERYGSKAKELRGEVPDGTLRLWGSVTVKAGDSAAATLSGGIETSGGRVNKGRGGLKIEAKDKETGAGISFEANADTEGKSSTKLGGSVTKDGVTFGGSYGVDSDGKRAFELSATGKDADSELASGVKVGGDSTGKAGISGTTKHEVLGEVDKQKLGDAGGVGPENWNIVEDKIASFDGNKLSLKVPIPGIGETRGAVDVESATFQIGASAKLTDSVDVSLDLAFKGISVDTIVHATDPSYPGVKHVPSELAKGEHWADLPPAKQAQYGRLAWNEAEWNARRKGPSPAAQEQLAQALEIFRSESGPLVADYEAKLAAAGSDAERQALVTEFEAAVGPQIAVIQEELRTILAEDGLL